MKAIEFHDAANIFPLDDENIPELSADIKKQGQQQAIELIDGKILDGRRRYLACRMAGVKPEFRTVSPADPVAYVLSLNLHRRHLSPTQLAMVAARAKEVYDKQAEGRMESGKGSDGSGGRGNKRNPPVNLPEGLQGDSRDLAGKAVGVSGKSVDFASKIIADGSSALVDAVDSDLIAVSYGARIARLPDEAQEAIVEDIKQRATTSSGKRVRKRREEDLPSNESSKENEPEPTGERRGVGVIKANEAINCLSRIPKNDALRNRGFQIVTDWIKANK